MKISFKHDAKHKKNNEVCVVTEYLLDNDESINFAIAKITGRYPTAGRMTNQKCKLLAYVQEGSGKIEIEGKEILLQVGDVVLIEPGEKYFWEGVMHLHVSCTPAWYPEQHRLVQECCDIEHH